MKWTIERITELCEEYCGKVGVEFTIPAKINGRLTRTLGRCVAEYNSVTGVVKSKSLEFSKVFLETATDESIEAVIGHECAHYVVIQKTRANHGHDEVFKSYCQKMGVDNDKTTYRPKSTVPNEKIYKYTLYCSKCGKFVTGRSRACKVTNHPEGYVSDCCDEALRVSKNW